MSLYEHMSNCVHDRYLKCTWADVQHNDPEKNETTYPLQLAAALRQFDSESAIFQTVTHK